MADVFIQEPATFGKVKIITNKGNIMVELWSRECPRTSRNFVQLCMEGYYNGCIFHRIIKDFIVQTGDPTGTGTGGESVYGEPFADEFHSRLKFRYRGMLGMANVGRGTNSSQFFVTLSKQEALNGRNAVFGKITGESIYTVNAIGDVDVDKDDRPLKGMSTPVIISCEVLENPFPDIVPRSVKPAPDAVESFRKKILPVKKIGARRTGLLSFADDDDFDRPAFPNRAQPSDSEEKSVAFEPIPAEEQTAPPPGVSASVQAELERLEAELLRVRKKPKIELFPVKEAPAASEDSVEEKLKRWMESVRGKTEDGPPTDEDVSCGNWLRGFGSVRFAVDSRTAYERAE